MTTILLILAAAAVLGGREMFDRLAALAGRLPRPEISWRQLAAAALIIVAIVSWHWESQVAPAPQPHPAPGPLELRGLFAGPTGAEDAAIVAALTAELADEIAWDGSQEEPQLTTGVALDDLRRRAREMRCRGESIGARQPAARDAIAGYLDKEVGNEGGPIDAAKRADWVRALRDISEAAALVTK